MIIEKAVNINHEKYQSKNVLPPFFQMSKAKNQERLKSVPN